MSSYAYARRRRRPWPALACLAAVTATGWAILNRPQGPLPGGAAPSAEAAAPTPRPRVDLAWVLDPAPVLRGSSATGFTRALPVLALNTIPPEAIPASVAVAVVAEATPAALTPPRRIAAAPAPAAPARVPLPVARPANLLAAVPPAAVQTPQAPAAAPQRMAARRALPRTRDVFRAAIAEEPSFLQRLFGGGAPAEGAGRALAYAGTDAVATPRPSLVPAPSASPSAGVAVYDISAGTVTLPSGEVLEAHSGYGALMDDPRHVHVRMRGATPPGTYEMTEREALFHGVRAIRLTPFGGSGAIHGRDGILAHTYMLRGQPGASNGCVVFRDYDRFLRAFLRGDVRRLIVVAGSRGGRLDMADRGR